MKLLLVVNNFNFGGPQKSLLNLLYELENYDLEIDLAILNGENQLQKYLPKYVNVIKIQKEIPLLMLSKNGIIKNIIKNLDNPILIINTIKFLLGSLFKSGARTQSKQKFWLKNAEKFNFSTKEYDCAIGVSGGHSIYYIVDYCKAKNKIGWIRTDYKVLNRNHDIDQKYFNKLNKVIAVSNMCAIEFEKIFKIKATTFYNSLPIKLYENIQEDFKIKVNAQLKLATICRLDYGKGLDLLLDAAERLRGLDIKWFIVGDGKLNKWLNKQIKSRKLTDIVIPLGFKFNTGSILKDIDVLVHPSRFEGKSNTIDEALYYHKPVIATNFDTVYEQITDDYNGYIVEMNGDDIAKAIKNLYKSDYKYEKLKSNIESQISISEVSKGDEFLNIIQSKEENYL